MGELSYLELNGRLLEIADEVARKNVVSMKEGLEKTNNAVETILETAITNTADRTLTNSYAGGLKINSLVGNKSEQDSTSGKNLFGDFSDVIIDSLGTVKRGVKVESTGTYTFSLSSGTVYYAYYSDAIGEFTTRQEISGSITITVSEYDYFIIYADSDEILNALGEAQLENGSTATEYEPYTGGMPSPNPSYPQEIKSTVVNEIKVVGKNLLQNTATSQTINGVTFTVNDDGTITANGKATGIVSFTIGSFIYTGGKSYILSGCPTGGSNSTYKIKAVESGSINDFGDGASIKYDTDRVDKISIIIYSGVTISNIIFKPMLSEVGGEYEPYTEEVITLSEPITLHGIGNAKDRIVRQDGVLVVKRNIGVLTIDGTESWTGSGTSFNKCVALNMTVADKLSGWNELKSNMLSYMSQSDYSNTDVNGIGGYSTMITVKVLKAVLDDFVGTNAQAVTVWKEYLAGLYANGNPMIVYYPLAEPTFEEILTADQIAFHSLPTYDTVTYINTDSEIEPVIDVEYGTSKIGAELLQAENKVEVLEIEKAILEKSKADVYTSCVELCSISDMTTSVPVHIELSYPKMLANYKKIIIKSTGCGYLEVDMTAFAMLIEMGSFTVHLIHILSSDYYIDFTITFHLGGNTISVSTAMAGYSSAGTLTFYGVK